MLFLTRFILRRIARYIRSKYRSEFRDSKLYLVHYFRKLYDFSLVYSVVFALFLTGVLTGNVLYIFLNGTLSIFYVFSVSRSLLSFVIPFAVSFKVRLVTNYIRFFFFYKQYFFSHNFYLEDLFCLRFLFFFFLLFVFIFWVQFFRDFLYYLTMLYSRIHYKVPSFTRNRVTDISFLDDVISYFLTNPKLIALTKNKNKLNETDLINYFFSYYPIEIHHLSSYWEGLQKDFSVSSNPYIDNWPKKRFLSGLGTDGISNGFFVIAFPIFICTLLVTFLFFFYTPYIFIVFFFLSSIAAFGFIFRIRYFVTSFYDYYSTSRRVFEHERSASLRYNFLLGDRNLTFFIPNIMSSLMSNNLRRIQSMLDLKSSEVSFKEDVIDSFDPKVPRSFEEYLVHNISNFSYNKKKGFLLKKKNTFFTNPNQRIFFFQKLDINFEDLFDALKPLKEVVNNKYKWRSGASSQNWLFLNFYRNFLIKNDPVTTSGDSLYFFFSPEKQKSFWIHPAIHFLEWAVDTIYSRTLAGSKISQKIQEKTGENIFEDIIEAKERVSRTSAMVYFGRQWFRFYDAVFPYDLRTEQLYFEFLYCFFKEGRYWAYIKWRVLYRVVGKFLRIFIFFFNNYIFKWFLRLPYRLLSLHDFFVYFFFRTFYLYWPAHFDLWIKKEVLFIHSLVGLVFDSFFFLCMCVWLFFKNPILFVSFQFRKYFFKCQLIYYYYVFGLNPLISSFYTQSIDSLLFQYFQQKFYVFTDAHIRRVNEVSSVERLFNLDPDANEREENLENRSYFGVLWRSWEFEAKDLFVGEFFIIFFLFYCHFLFFVFSGLVLLIFFNLSVQESLNSFVHVLFPFNTDHATNFFKFGGLLAIGEFLSFMVYEQFFSDVFRLDFLLFENWAFAKPNWKDVLSNNKLRTVVSDLVVDRIDDRFTKENKVGIKDKLGKKTMYSDYFFDRTYFGSGEREKETNTSLLVNEEYRKLVLYWYKNADEIRTNYDPTVVEELENGDENVDPILLNPRTEMYINRYLQEPLTLYRRNFYSNNTYCFYSGDLLPGFLYSDGTQGHVDDIAEEKKKTKPFEFIEGFSDRQYYRRELIRGPEIEDQKMFRAYYFGNLPYVWYLELKRKVFDFIFALWQYHLLRVVYYIDCVFYKKYILANCIIPIGQYLISYISFYGMFFSQIKQALVLFFWTKRKKKS